MWILARGARHGIGVSGLASTPYNVAVGGTDFGDTYQARPIVYWGPTQQRQLRFGPLLYSGNSLERFLRRLHRVGLHGAIPSGYGSAGFCGSTVAQLSGTLAMGAGSGGPSGCATGAPAENLVVGGTCKGYAKPSWQTGCTGISSDGVRDLPDVSLFAADGRVGPLLCVLLFRSCQRRSAVQRYAG